MTKHTLSCKDLHHSVYLAPNQIRTCCKRFFVNGEQKGDVVLLNIEENLPTPQSILEAKQELYEKINNGEPNPCDGCPFLEKSDWGTIDKLELKHLSFEYHSVCNLKCNYCSDTYYGGLKSKYDVLELLQSLRDKKALEGCESVVWGGGEPTLDKQFMPLITQIDNDFNLHQRVFTNALKFNNGLSKLINGGRVMITTSIDAGLEDTFRKVRGYSGKNGLRNVLKNLKIYSKKHPENINIKYIFTFENNRIPEVEAFIEKITKSNLINCNFQISVNYKLEKIPETYVLPVIIMFGLLRKQKSNRIFIDDLLWHRISDSFSKNKSTINNQIENAGYGDLLADPNHYNDVIVWGAGHIAKEVVLKSEFFKNAKILFFVDSNPEKQGSLFLEKEIKSPQSVQSVNNPIFIAAAQDYPAIFAQISQMGVEKHRIISSIVI